MVRFLTRAWLTIWFCFCVASTGLAAETEPVSSSDDRALEHWYRLEVDGIPAGWMLQREIREASKLTTVSRLQLRFQRADTAQTFEIDSRFTETLDGQPLSAWSKQTLGHLPLEMSWKFLPHEVLVDTVHGETSEQQRVSLPPSGWLTPGQTELRLQQFLKEGAQRFTLSSLDPQLGLEVVDTEWIFDGEEVLQIDGEAVNTRRFRQRQSYMPQLETVAHVNAEGLTVRSTTPMLGLTMTSTLTRRERALERGPGPELMARTFIYPDRAIPSPRQARKVRYEIRRVGAAEVALSESLPSTGAQRVESIQIPPSPEDSLEDATEAVQVVVEVDLPGLARDPKNKGAEPKEDLDRAELEPYLRTSTFVDHQSPGVRSLLAEALEIPESADDTSDDAPQSLTTFERAETLRAFVAEYLNDKNLDSILATAGEVAASRSGDCTEHSVLLTALLRAAEIPARAVTGLVYVQFLAGERELFGYHMWTQAWIGDRWIDFDATLNTPFDAAHIAFGTTALNDDHGTLKELARLATLIGQVEIRVLDVEH